MKRLLLLFLSFIISGMSLQGSEAAALDDGYKKRLANIAVIEWLLENPEDRSPSMEIPYACTALKKKNPMSSFPHVLQLSTDLNTRTLNSLVLECGAMNFYALISVLEQLGANLNAKSEKTEKTALIYASGFGHTEMAKFLLDHGAEINTRNCDGDTALVYAIVQGQSQIADLLLLHRATVDEAIAKRCREASEGNNIQLLKLLDIYKPKKKPQKTSMKKKSILARRGLKPLFIKPFKPLIKPKDQFTRTLVHEITQYSA